MTLRQYLDSLKSKTVAVIGIGVSNTPLLRLLLREGICVTACDKRERSALGELADELEKGGCRLQLGADYLHGLDQDVIFRTPGLRPDVPELLQAQQQGSELTSEMEVFFSVCPCTLIAVTGSDGKTTTTTIIAELLKAAGKTVHVGGNIGNPLLCQADEMRPEDYAVPYQEDAAIGDTGDGHMMGLKVGANMDPVPHCAMIFSGGYPDEASRRCPAKQMVRAVAPLVDGRGRRFCNEAHQKECVANALNTAHTFNGGAWFIFDQDVMDTMKEPMDKYFANGTLAKGETLDDLAKALGIPAERLKETIDTWNGYFDAETPTDLAFRRDLVSVNPVVKAFTEGKVQASALPVKRGPFYSMTCSATFLTTVSGLIIDEKCRVLDTSGDVIEGLYAGGNASGGMYSDVYPRHLPSTSVGRAATFGYVAARHATKGE